MTLPPDRSQVLSETVDPVHADLHRRDLDGLLTAFDEANAAAVAAVRAARPQIAAFLAEAEGGFETGGRLVYLGAGTSGRLGVLDASECPPTFQVSPDRVIGIIAGGDGALRRSSEGAEDDPAGALPALRDLALGGRDALVGIAAGGTTPYVRGALEWAARLGEAPVTALLSCSPCAVPEGCRHLIVVATGPEVVAGSTRMKAGTATKLVLNAISTALMVRSGRVYRGLMVDVKASNAKLRDRAARIVSTLTGVARDEAFVLLDRAGGSVKTAVVMQRAGVGRAEAEAHLASAAGRLDRVLGG